MTMVLSENAQNEYTALIHELGEFGLAYDRKGMKNLQESLIKYWATKDGITGMNDINSLVDEYQRRYKAVEGSKTRSQAMDEIVNDALGGLFSTDEGVQEFADWLKKDSGYTKGEQKTIVQRFIDTMDSIIKYLKTKLKDMSLTKAARKALELERQQAEDIRKQFLDVLDHAIEEANTTGEYQAEDGVKYSIKEIKGEKEDYGIGVYLDTDFFDGVKPRDWGKKIRDFVYNNLAGKELTVYNDGEAETIYLAKKSDRVKKDGANNGHRVIDKLARYRYGDNVRSMSIVHIDELAETSKYFDENSEHTHQWLDEKGWEYRTAYAQDRNGKVYEMVLNIGKGNERNILYDINKIKEIDHGVVVSEATSSTKETKVANGLAHKNQSLESIITDNPENASRKFSLPEEYDRVRRENETLLRENETFKQIIDSLEHTLDIKEGIKLNEQSIEKAAKNMLRKYKSNVDPKSFVENVTALFQAAAKNEMSASDFEYLAESIVRPLIEQSENNLQISDYAKGVLNDIKKTTIKLDGSQKKESAYHYGSYANLRKNLFGRVNFSDQGTSLNTLWKQWSEAYPGLFDENISPVDQPVKLAEIIKSLKEDYVNEYGFDIDDAVSYATAELLNEYANIPEVGNLLDAKKKSEFRVRYRELTNMIKSFPLWKQGVKLGR